MSRHGVVPCFRFLVVVLAISMMGVPSPGLAHEVDQTTSDPGFRPDSDLAAAFVDTLGSSAVAVYPVIVRRADRTAHSFAAQEQIVTFINQQDLANATGSPLRIDLGGLKGRSQWDLFESDMQRIGEALQGRTPAVGYHFFMAVVLPVSNQRVFGIHCYVLDDQGRNVFSFLLNSHHELFVDARLYARNSSEEARSQLMTKAIQAGMEAFSAQLDRAR